MIRCRRLKPEIAGDLVGHELVVRQIVVERADHPRAERAHVAVVIVVDPVGVREPHEVEPVPGHVLAVLRLREQAVDEPRVRVGPLVREKRVDILARRRQAREVEAQPADQRARISPRARLELVLLQLAHDEAIDRASVPRRVADLRLLGVLRRDERPVPLVLRALVDPPADRVDLLGRQRTLVRALRRHAFVYVLGRQPIPDRALGERPRLDRLHALASPIGALGTVGAVETQVGLAHVLGGAVALEALVGEDRPDVTVETDRLGGHPRGQP